MVFHFEVIGSRYCDRKDTNSIQLLDFFVGKTLEKKWMPQIIVGMKWFHTHNALSIVPIAESLPNKRLPLFAQGGTRQEMVLAFTY